MRNTCYISLFNPYSNGADNTQVKPCVTNLNSSQLDIFIYICMYIFMYIFAVALFSFSFRVPLPPTVRPCLMHGPICLSPLFLPNWPTVLRALFETMNAGVFALATNVPRSLCCAAHRSPVAGHMHLFT